MSMYFEFTEITAGFTCIRVGLWPAGDGWCVGEKGNQTAGGRDEADAIRDLFQSAFAYRRVRLPLAPMFVDVYCADRLPLCGDCDGTGWLVLFTSEDDCTTCRGTGIALSAGLLSALQRFDDLVWLQSERDQLPIERAT